MYIGKSSVLLIALSALLCLAPGVRSQNIYSLDDDAGKRGFLLDYAQFRSDQEGLDRLELYYKVFNNSLQFVRDGDKFRADYEITVTIYDKGKRQVTAFSKERSFRVSSYESTISPRNFRISQIDKLLPPGKYKIECHLIDKNSGSDMKRTIKAELTKYDNRNAQISGVEFAIAIDTTIIDSAFLKGNLTVIPSVSREYGGDSTSSLLCYLEIYQGSNKREDVLIETSVFDRKMDYVYHDSSTSQFNENEAVIRQVRQISLDGLKSGDYTLEVVLKGRRERIIDRLKAPFVVYWRPEAVVRHDYETAVMQLKYIADSDEIKKLKKADTPMARVAAWNEFWLSHDPSPGTPENELKESYYRRIEQANRNFRVMKKEGWRTDRGMIFIQYGEPDQIEDYPFESNTKAYQIWYYYGLKVPRKFVFVDNWGDGDFQLQYPYDGRAW